MRRVLLLIMLMLFAAAAAPAQFRAGGFHRGYGGFAAPVFPSAYDYFYPSHFPPYPYPAPMAQEAPSRVFVAEATHDWRNWPPPRKIITGPLTREEADRLAAASMPPPPPPQEPLGDVARRLRAQAARGQRAIIRAWN